MQGSSRPLMKGRSGVGRGSWNTSKAAACMCTIALSVSSACGYAGVNASTTDRQCFCQHCARQRLDDLE